MGKQRKPAAFKPEPRTTAYLAPKKEESKIIVIESNRTDGAILYAKEARKLAAWLLKAADWLEGRERDERS